MSVVEDPVLTVARLLRQYTNQAVLKDNGSFAKIPVTTQIFDRKFLQENDAQITVALEQSMDQKLELAGRLRRRSVIVKSTIWTTDKSAPDADPGQVMRDKLIVKINTIIRERRNLPNQAPYNFLGLGHPEGDPHKAFQAGAGSELSPGAAGWAELSALEYAKIWRSDDDRYSKSHNVNNEYALILFRFKIDAREDVLKKIVFSYEGYGTAPGGNGVTIKIWNPFSVAWEEAQTGSGSGDETITITISEDCDNFVDANDYIWLLARTTNPSNGVTPAVLYCDFADLIIQVNGLAFCDVVGYRHAPVNPDVKPYLFQTDFTLKGWLFESISGAF
jgi:hypothetical protein